MRLVVERLKEVDLKAQTVRAAVNLESSWTDSAEPLCGGGPVRVDSIDMAGGRFTVHSDAEHCFFTPRLVLKNQLSVEGTQEEWLLIHPPKRGMRNVILEWHCKMDVIVQTDFSLASFPFDTQNAVFELVSYWSPSQSFDPEMNSVEGKVEVRLIANLRWRSLVRLENCPVGDEYLVSSKVRFISGDTTPADDSATGCRYPRVRAMVHLERKPAWFVWNVMLPLYTFTLALFCAWVPEPDDFGTRSGITLTLLLTMVAFKIIISDRLPLIPYLTALDIYVLGCFGISLLVLLVNVGAALETTVELGDTSASSIMRDAPSRRDAVLWSMVVWTILHIVAGVAAYMWRAHRRKENCAWWQRANALWIGPLDGNLTEQQAEERVREVLAVVTNGEHMPVAQRFYNGGCPAKGYTGTKPFAVARMKSEHAAASARVDAQKRAPSLAARGLPKVEELAADWYDALVPSAAALPAGGRGGRVAAQETGQGGKSKPAWSRAV